MKETTTKADENTSDGYHTFKELYQHRDSLFIALCKQISMNSGYGYVWRSKLHSDGTMFDGYFIMGMGTDKHKGKQITYHMPLAEWDQAEVGNVATLDMAPEYDGHTPEDVLERLKSV